MGVVPAPVDVVRPVREGELTGQLLVCPPPRPVDRRRNLRWSAAASGVNLQFFSIEPATPLRVTLKRGDAALFNDAVQADPKNGNRISATIPADGSGEQVQLTIRTGEGKELIAAETRMK
jgi:hypothetical protein